MWPTGRIRSAVMPASRNRPSPLAITRRTWSRGRGPAITVVVGCAVVVGTSVVLGATVVVSATTVVVVASAVVVVAASATVVDVGGEVDVGGSVTTVLLRSRTKV